MKIIIEYKDEKYLGADYEYAQELCKGLLKFAKRCNQGGDMSLVMKDDDVLNTKIFDGHDIHIEKIILKAVK